MAGEYDEQMKSSPMKNVKEFYSKIPNAIENKGLTYAGWLSYVEGLSQEEIGKLFEDVDKSDELQKKYAGWLSLNVQEVKT